MTTGGAASVGHTQAASSYSPSFDDDVRAAWRWVQASWAGQHQPSVLTLIGLGNGAVLAALDQFAPTVRVLALEPDPVSARRVRAQSATERWLAAGRLVLLDAPEFSGADQAWRIFPKQFQNPAFAVHPGVEHGPMVAKAASVLKHILFGVEANAKARAKFAPKYLVNSLLNAPGLVTGRSIARLTDACAGIPAVIVGAGPSLDEAYDDLRTAAGRALIIASDTALRPLLVNGIVPHLVVGLDPGDLNARHFLSLPECRDTWLVAESALDQQATAAFAGRTFWCSVGDHHPWPWLSTFGVEPGFLEVWGSVITGAFQVARLAGCDPIVTVGADLSFPGGRPYARGTTYEFDWAWAAACGTSAADTWRAQMQRPDIVRRPGVDGVDVMTTDVLMSFRDWLVAQAGKSGRRLVNASRRGMLFGAGVEQAPIGSVLGGVVSVPSFRTLAVPRSDVRPSAVAKDMRALADLVRRGQHDAAPVTDWVEFSGRGFNADEVARALESAALSLDSKRGGPAPSLTIPQTLFEGSPVLAQVLTSLPEAISRLRDSRSGPPAVSLSRAVTGGEPSDVLRRAFALLTAICNDVAHGRDFVSWPDPSRVASVPPGGVCMWPETTRWAVLALEGLLAQVVGPMPMAPVSSSPFYAGAVSARESSGATRKGDRPALRFAAHACVLIVLEWLHAVRNTEPAGDQGLDGGLTRLIALERLMRMWPPPAGGGTPVDLVVSLDDEPTGHAVSVPLPLSEEMLARVATGTTHQARDAAWELAHSDRAAVSVRVSLRARPQSRPSASTALRSAGADASRIVAVTPRVLTDGARPAVSVAGSVDDAVLGVVPLTQATVLVRADGSISSYQEWPRPVTGGLSLGTSGDVAWSNVWSPKPGGTRPFLMHRTQGTAEPRVYDLPFRPSSGVWWNGSVYLNGQPTPNVPGGIGVWSPDGSVSLSGRTYSSFRRSPMSTVSSSTR